MSSHRSTLPLIHETEPELELKPELESAALYSEPPTIITIAIISHGQDIPSEPFFDENVRIISFAGRSGSGYFASPGILDNIKKKFNEKFATYNRSLPKKNKKKILSQLYEENPTANKCETTPNFTFQDDAATPHSSYQFLADTFVNPHSKLDLKKKPEAFDILREPIDYYNIFGIERYERSPSHMTRGDELIYEDMREGLTHRIHSPVINKYYFLYDSRLGERFNFGIHVLDICNYNKKMPGHVNIKVGENLASSRAAYNADFLRKVNASKSERREDQVTLRNICEYLHSIGFHTINIIDVACRITTEMHSPTGTRRKQVTALEEEHFSRQNLAYGLKRANVLDKKEKNSKKNKTRKNKKSKTRKSKTRKI